MVGPWRLAPNCSQPPDPRSQPRTDPRLPASQAYGCSHDRSSELLASSGPCNDFILLSRMSCELILDPGRHGHLPRRLGFGIGLTEVDFPGHHLRDVTVSAQLYAQRPRAKTSEWVLAIVLFRRDEAKYASGQALMGTSFSH